MSGRSLGKRVSSVDSFLDAFKPLNSDAKLKNAPEYLTTSSFLSSPSVIGSSRSVNNSRRKISRNGGERMKTFEFSREKDSIEKPYQQLRKSAPSIATSSFNNILRESAEDEKDIHKGEEGDCPSCTGKFSNRHHEKHWINPPPATDGEQILEFPLRSVDLAYLWHPSIKVVLRFPSRICSEKLLEGFNEAVKQFPLVAGRLSVKKMPMSEKDVEEVKAMGLDIEEAEAEVPHSLVSVVNLELAGKKSGALFEVAHYSPKAFRNLSHNKMFAKSLSPMPNKDALIKVKLNSCNEESVLAIDFARVVGDWESFYMFMHNWSLHSGVKKNMRHCQRPRLERTLHLSTPEFLSLNRVKQECLNQKPSDINSLYLTKAQSKSHHVREMQIPARAVQSIKKEFNTWKKSRDTFSDADSDHDFLIETRITEYMVLTALASIAWKELKGDSSESFVGQFCIDTRMKLLSQHYDYFGSASAYLDFEMQLDKEPAFSDLKDGKLSPRICQSLEGVAESFHRCCNNKKKLFQLELMYEALLSGDDPLSRLKGRDLKLNPKFQKPFLDIQRSSKPVFESTCEAENHDFTALRFAGQKCSDMEIDDSFFRQNLVLISKRNPQTFVIRFVVDRVMERNWQSAVQAVGVVEG